MIRPLLNLFRKNPLRAATEARQAARDAYLEAVERGDTRLQFERREELCRATRAVLALETGRVV